MNRKEYIQDIICQVLVPTKSKALIYAVLNEFIPEYETINLDYTGKPNNENYQFQSEDEMISCYIETQNVNQTFYWNKYENNLDKIMVGANITNDNQIVFSLTFDGNLKTEAKYYLRLKRFLKSKIGVISYINPAEYDDAKDFIKKYENQIYEFEK
ncbi:hypothetical protein [uncultured Olleya sp.]|uniref:hypothetical protein n=1 Tax=uncultured Olleya sp. TaxID=757243 RepID=UPI002595BE53|nr:hypothetical protein [uncultured Olleya sp.]